MKKNFVGEVNMTDEEIAESAHMSEYPEKVICTDFMNYDLSMHAPDVVYIQNPYDEANPCHTVPSYFYASNVRKYAEKVIYVPIAGTAEFSQVDGSDMYNMRHYVTAPGVIAADKVLVQSENIRSLYIDVLSVFAGQATEDVWKKKIVVAEEYIETLTENGTINPMSQFLITILAEVARMERKTIRERVESGYKNYRANGGKVGRKEGYRKSDIEMKEQYAEEIRLLRKGISLRDISKITGTSINTIRKCQVFIC